MTTFDRYQPYYMEADGQELVFYRSKRDESGVIRHDISTSHLVSTDSSKRKCLCQS